MKLTTVASYKEGNSSSSWGGGIYSVSMAANSGGGQQTGMGGTTGISGTGPTGGAGGSGQPGAGTQYQTFAISCRNSIVILNFVKWQTNKHIKFNFHVFILKKTNIYILH